MYLIKYRSKYVFFISVYTREVIKKTKTNRIFSYFNKTKEFITRNILIISELKI